MSIKPHSQLMTREEVFKARDSIKGLYLINKLFKKSQISALF